MTPAPNPAVEARVDRLHAHGIVDMHFDMLMDLYDKRARAGVLDADYLPELEQGGVGILGAAIYIEDKYLPEQALRIALGQVARLYEEVDRTARFAICRTHAEIVSARSAGKVALLITMEGVEPLGTDLNLLRVFYELGLRSVGLTHARRNMAGDGGIFAPSGSSRHGLSDFGRAVVAECQRLGLLVGPGPPNPARPGEPPARRNGAPVFPPTPPRTFSGLPRHR